MDAKSLFLEGFYSARAAYADTPASEIRGAGKPTKANPRGEDETWWLANGPAMVQRWMDWRMSSGWKIWSAPDGRPGVELELRPLFGGVEVVMYVDRVFVTPAGTLVVVDLKSGKRSPTSDLQLAFYAAGIYLTYGIEVKYGGYWDARSGEMAPLQHLSRLTPELISHWISGFVKAREMGIFLPNISDKCRPCGVNKYCAAYGGKFMERDPDYRAVYGEGGAHEQQS